MSVIKFDRDFSTLFNWDTDENPTTEQDYQNAVKNWTETEMNIVDTLLWQPTTEYATGNIVKTPSLPSQYVLRCTETGTSGSTEPDYSGASVGDTVTDGSVEWVIVSLATGNAADVDASNIGVNAEVDNSEAWGNAIGGGAIAEDDGRLVKGDTVYAVTSVMETNIATNTEAIEDNTEAIATNTANIEASAVKIDIDDKRISNIEKLLQGNLYDYQTDSTSAYTKTVLNGAMPWASLDSVGGKTVVWNQLVQDPTMTDVSKWQVFIQPASFSVSVADNVLTISRTDNNYNMNFGPATSGINIVNGHKYYISSEVKANNACAGYYRIGTANIVVINITTSFTKFAEIITSSVDSQNIGINITYSALGDGAVVNVKNFVIVDLTLLYGAGNEPSTVAEFESMFPASYYSYNAGTLLSAGVTEVVSQGKNLADYSGGAGVPSNNATANTTKRIFPIGKYIVGLSSNNYYYPIYITSLTVTENSIAIQTSQSGYGVGIPFNCSAGISYVFSVSASNYFSVSWYAEDGTFLSFTTFSNVKSGIVTAPSGAKQGILLLRPPSVNSLSTFSNIQLEYGSTATDYVPAKQIPLATYPIPTAIRNLDGYGWSAGQVYNYIDYEAKKFIQNVASVDLSTLTWGYGPSVGWSATLNAKNPADDDTVFNGISATLTPVTRNAQATAFSGGTDAGMVSVSGGKVYVGTGDIGIVPSGTLYYELDEPVETDISAYLTDDNLIEVEAGGTLTFENQNGDDYRIPIPSSETYMVDLQSAI